MIETTIEEHVAEIHRLMECELVNCDAKRRVFLFAQQEWLINWFDKFRQWLATDT